MQTRSALANTQATKVLEFDLARLGKELLFLSSGSVVVVAVGVRGMGAEKYGAGQVGASAGESFGLE